MISLLHVTVLYLQALIITHYSLLFVVGVQIDCSSTVIHDNCESTQSNVKLIMFVYHFN